MNTYYIPINKYYDIFFVERIDYKKENIYIKCFYYRSELELIVKFYENLSGVLTFVNDIPNDINGMKMELYIVEVRSDLSFRKMDKTEYERYSLLL